ncbi:MAG: hydrogenase formation protein HypD, partial [Candidatus Thermoplasmatota archaeon]|nr:hydrogenase formation protein HypD [Candidatus Thermoplasmatota archaeon]
MFKLRDKNLAGTIIEKLQGSSTSYTFMHVCGTHQDALVKNGLDKLFEKVGIIVIQGPGCPVCVTSPTEIEEVIYLANQGITVATFGDMIRVPGASSSLQHERSKGCDIQTVYSIEDAVQHAIAHQDKEVVFMAVGFETTAPTTAIAIQSQPPDNFSILCCHRTMPAALKAILDMGERKIDGFIQPGHVSTIIGTHPYEFISTDYHVPQVIAGFEPLDILMGVWLLVQQHTKGTAEVKNEYTRVVHPEGNLKALQVLNSVFQPCDMKWRGFPIIKGSGLELKSTYRRYDARKRYKDLLTHIPSDEFTEPPGCRCGELLRGLCTPHECPLFAKKCTPDTPIGACMVSVEGSCNIEYR